MRDNDLKPLEDATPNILFTAFKGNANPSFQLVNQLGGSTLFLTNSFSGLEKEIEALKEEFGAICMFGVDKHLTGEVRIEACAEYNHATIPSELDIPALSGQMASYQIRHHISHTPTKYLCNAAYYHMLRKNRHTVFIHIPSCKGMDDDFMAQLVKLFTDLAALGSGM